MENSPHYSTDSYIPVFGNNQQESQSSRINVKVKDNYDTRGRFLEESCRITPADAPWKKRELYSYGIIGLHEEINDFYEVMRPTEKETEIRLKVIEHITRVVHSLWPQAQVEIFGSFRTQLYLPSSDIDMVIMGEWKSIPLSTLSRALESNGVLNKDINVIANATVPIIRLVHSPSNIRVDISFNLTNGVKSAKLIKKMMKEHPALPKLVLVLKQFLIHRGLNEVYNGGMSSYCLTLLIVSFLQGYHKPKYEPSLNLGTLLLEFFEHYGINFNYENVSIHFDSGGLYRPRFKMGSYLCIEDPLMEGHDVAKGTYLMHLLKLAFQQAFYTLSKAVNESEGSKTPVGSFLHLVLKVDPEVFNNQQLMLNNYSKLMKTLSQLIERVSESLCPQPVLSSTPATSKRFSMKRKKLR